MHNRIAVIALLLLSFFTILSPAGAQTTKNHWIVENVINPICETITFVAWPTANYRSCEVSDIRRYDGYVVITEKFNATSAFTGGPIWFKLRFKFDARTGEMLDMELEDYFSVFPPFASAVTWGVVISEMIKEQSQR